MLKSPLILASRSPRRRKLLAEAGYEFTVVEPDIDESILAGEFGDSYECARELALAKAKSVAVKFTDSVVIGADTVVDFDGEIIGKAADKDDAGQIVEKLFSRVHKVITGIAIVKLDEGIELVESDMTVVYPKKMSSEQITEHLKGGSWRDKAGAYAIQETGDEFVEKIEGSLTNVMGLPMELLGQMLERFMD